jgi:excalibur calcium-binding domain-containing protein
MQDGKIIPFRGARRPRDDRAGRRWPVQMPITVGLLGFVCGVLYVSAPLNVAAPLGSKPVMLNGTGTTAANGSVYYPNCAAARADGVAPLYLGQPGYRAPLDADGDGVACEPYRGR